MYISGAGSVYRKSNGCFSSVPVDKIMSVSVDKIGSVLVDKT